VQGTRGSLKNAADRGIVAVAAVVTIYPDASELGDHLACEILDGIGRARSARRRFLLGCPGGRSLLSTYQGLERRIRDTRADLAHLVIVMMDEYVVPSGDGFRYCPAHLHYSCRRFAEHEIRGRLNHAIPFGGRIPPDNVWLPDPADPGAFDARLAAAGGVDLFLLASGASDGHVGFNPPGTAIDSGSRVVRLAETTRRDNLGTFPAFEELAAVPTHGVSVGLGTIARLSASVVMVLNGAHKQAAALRLLSEAAFTPDWPATIVHACRNARIALDESAAQTGRRSGLV
jgi:glucosamine-6-phosphate deaminase